MEDGAWMLWENSSVVVVAVAHPGLEKLLEFHYGIGPSGVRGSIRLVFRSTDARILLFFPHILCVGFLFFFVIRQSPPRLLVKNPSQDQFNPRK